MLADKRISTIMELLNDKGSATIEELATTLEVSEMTIRRDLEKCRQLGGVHRCHGGAILSSKVIGEMSYEQKEAENKQIKRQLATYAAGLVSPGDSVFLDAGTTTYCIAEQICHIPNLTIITGDLNIGVFLTKSGANTIMLGGQLQNSTCSVLGGIAQSLLENIHVSVAFTGAMSINENLDILTPTIEKAFLKRQVLASASECFLVVDASKFNRQALHYIGNLSEYTAVITNAKFTEAQRHIIKQKDIKIVQVE